MKKTALLIFILFTFILSNAQQPNTNVWTATYEKGVFDQFDNMSKSQIQSEYERARFCQCCVDGVKEILPRGLESVSDKRLKEITVSVANTCKEKIKAELIFTKWTPDIEKKLKVFFYHTYSDNSISENIKKEYCDCMVVLLKKEYPHGMNGKISDPIMVRVTGDCAKEIIKKHPELDKN